MLSTVLLVLAVLVAPRDRRDTARLQLLAAELSIADRCRWIPWVSDTERMELLNRCQALVIASLWEGFGLPDNGLLERLP